ncbi:hypothetical protein EYF80_062324 [Liparis tanakae]|uniref:Uncharacterized protein n=1 Tax=Liparis tanakae TaxID=230148 RepID=A0A4Z2EFW4_9TELE|nr:hypothetical protein EYF80_062324 [Liparis tanakae]
MSPEPGEPDRSLLDRPGGTGPDRGLLDRPGGTGPARGNRTSPGEPDRTGGYWTGPGEPDRTGGYWTGPGEPDRTGGAGPVRGLLDRPVGSYQSCSSKHSSHVVLVDHKTRPDRFRPPEGLGPPGSSWNPQLLHEDSSVESHDQQHLILNGAMATRNHDKPPGTQPDRSWSSRSTWSSIEEQVLLVLQVHLVLYRGAGPPGPPERSWSSRQELVYLVHLVL